MHILPQHIPIYEKMGYKIRTMDMVDPPPDFPIGIDATPCRICEGIDIERTMYLCKHCNVGQHEGCDGLGHQDVDWTCPDCRRSPCKYGTTNRVARITWEPVPEPEEQLTRTVDDWHTHLTRYEEDKNRARSLKKYGTGSKRTQQGLPDRSPHAPIPGHLRNLVEINIQAIHPDTDLTPTGTAHLQVGRVDRYTGHVVETELVHVYDGQGTLRGTITLDRARTLEKWYHATAMHKPEVHKELQTMGFAEEVVLLMDRYKEGYKERGAGSTKLKNHWALPNEYMQALQKGCGVDQEAFASPLNFHPGMAGYFSKYDRDRVFGAKHNSLAHRLHGALEVNPEYEPEDVDKAMRWAITCAEQGEEPFLAIMVLPDWQGTAYKQRMTRTVVHDLVTVNRRQFKFKSATHWQSIQEYKLRQPEMGGQICVGRQPRWDTTLLQPQKTAETHARGGQTAGHHHSSTHPGECAKTRDGREGPLPEIHQC